jgi:ribosomal-protein-alanine N-acetyltransferase|tara:strand:+ start:2109 stop:2582 length:474 start_codon:yes stop_codon:yes gene_type:complete
MLVADLADVLAIENVAHLNPWTEKAFVDCMGSSEKGYACQVVVYERQIVGYAMLSEAAEEAHLLNIAIDPEQQGLGLGRRWLGWAISWAVAQKSQTMFLEVRSGNLVALSLYESAGFNRIGLRRDYYPSLLGREDAVVMGLDLSGLDIQEVTDSTEV